MNTGELYPVTKIIIDKTETFAICVNSEGAIFIYIIDIKEKLVWELHKKIDEGQGEVSSLEINENLGIFNILAILNIRDILDIIIYFLNI